MVTVQVSKEGKVTIPASIREKYGIFPGMKLRVADEDGVITLRPLLQDVLKEAVNQLSSFQGEKAILSR